MLLHACTIFLSAFLLFLVQPVIAKQILPWFGGAASVWATCLVFFQSMLLLGYAYADWTSRYLKPRRQAVLHAILLGVSLLLLPIIPDAGWKPGGEGDAGPTYLILGLLGTTIGLQYFLLSATSPLVQAWFWQRFRHGVPYRLFALSNFASLLALLSYPVLVEPFFPLAMQSIGWSGAYAVFAVLCAATALTSARHAALSPISGVAAETADAGDPSPRILDRLVWIVLAALGSCLLLAVTNHLTQNVASIPFLWVVPLSLYLITFILCFDHPRWYQRKLFLMLVALLLPTMAWFSNSLELWIAAPIYALGLFVCCMFCHGELYMLKPGPRHLTTFYLMISIGGSLGALLVGIVAPNFLSGYYELEITLIALAALLFSRTVQNRWAASGACAVVAATVAFVALNIEEYVADTRVMSRNFYGVVRTRDFPDPIPFRVMYHGSIKHGGQLLEAGSRNAPSSYFGPTSGYGRVFASMPDAPRRVGVIGLGAGAIAAYARRGDLFRFYEIDPQVTALAMTEFSFLRDSQAQMEVALGDGRLTLEREPDQRFDLLAIDAFSGDSIPMHLITLEAMATYVRHIKPDGVIVFQATNRFVDIAPVVERLAAAFGMTAMLVSDHPEEAKGADYWLSNSDQIIVTRNAELLKAHPIRSVAELLPPRPEFRVWTDDFYNLLKILK